MLLDVKKILSICSLACGIALVFQSGNLFANAIENPPVVSTEKIYEGIGAPVDMDFTGIEGDDRVFATELGGSVRINGVNYNTPYLDITEKVEVQSEKGMLGMTFDPNYAENGYFYLYYTGPTDEDTGEFTVYLERYTVSDEPNFADKDSAFTILQFQQQSPFHNGGSVAFGPDGYLYVGIGDDTSAATVQDLNFFNGKILRIDVSPEAGDIPAECDLVSGNYSIPADNPYVGQAGCGEIWSIGFRNPWRFNFDSLTGDFYIGDVGDERTEELNFQPADSTGGENYGWPYFEGNLCHDTNFTQAECDSFENHTPPIFDYPHSSGGGSITGGFVYRGTRFPRLVGHYIFGDFTNSQIWTAINVDDSWEIIDHGKFNTDLPLLSSFGQNPQGEVFAVSFTNGETGSIHRILDEYGFEITLQAPAAVEADETIEYQLAVENMGSVDQADVIVSNKIPEGVTYVSGGLLSGPNIFLPISEIKAGETVTVSWVAQPTTDVVVNDTYSASVVGQPEVTGIGPITTTAPIVDRSALISGRFFEDTDRDGVMEEGEVGIIGVKANIWQDTACNGQVSTNPPTDFVTDVTSGLDGEFSYTVEDKTICYLLQIDLSTMPNGYSISPLNAKGDDEVDSDFYSFGWTDSFSLPTQSVNGGFFDPSKPFEKEPTLIYLPLIR